jgi:hypothetical protein
VQFLLSNQARYESCTALLLKFNCSQHQEEHFDKSDKAHQRHCTVLCCAVLFDYVQGHLTNAALWGPEKHQHNSSSNGGGPNLGSSSSSNDPAQQPVWSLQQLFNVLGQKQADAVWQQIADTAGLLVASKAVEKGATVRQ